MELIDKMNDVAEFCEEKIRECELKIITLPKGSFSIYSDRGHCVCKIGEKNPVTGKTEYRVLHADETEIAADYAYRIYLEQIVKDCSNELQAIKAYRKKRSDRYLGIPKFKHQDDYNKLLCIRMTPTLHEDQKYLEDRFVVSTKGFNERRIKTLRGDSARSKSESLIANELFKRGYAYLYEPIVSALEMAV